MHRRRTPPGLWKHGPIPVIGLVGGIGAGKSRAAEAFARRGALVIDADAVGHALLEQRPARDRVLARFGPSILEPSSMAEDAETPRIDRRALGALVFDDPSARRSLEAILHPAMRVTFEKAIARTTRKRRHSAVVLDAAVLFEAGWDDLCDLVAFIEAPRDLRRARLKATRGWTDAMLTQREAAQLSLEEKRQRADAVLSNAGDPAQLDEAVGRFWTRCVESVTRTSHP